MQVLDPELPATVALLSEDADAVVRPAYASMGVDLEALEIRQVMYEPGLSLSVRYAATLVTLDAAATRWVEPVVAAIDVDGPIDGSLVVSDGDLTVGLFRWPHDPGLPGLVGAADTSVHPHWWVGCGLDLEVEVLTYRPGRRAVLRGRGNAGEVYVKVLTPRKAARVLRRLRDLEAVGLPVPRVIDADRVDGVVVLEALPGVTLRTASFEVPTPDLPHPRALVELLDRFPAAWVGKARTVAPPSEHAARHARLLRRVVPELADELDLIVERVQRVPRGTAVPVHGDFHDDQLMVIDGDIVGVLDVDGAGVGCREDDLGTFLAHLHNLSLDNRGPGHQHYVERVTQEFLNSAYASAVAAQTAAALVGLATGPYRVQEIGWRDRVAQRVRLAHEWTDRM